MEKNAKHAVSPSPHPPNQNCAVPLPRQGQSSTIDNSKTWSASRADSKGHYGRNSKRVKENVEWGDVIAKGVNRVSHSGYRREIPDAVVYRTNSMCRAVYAMCCPSFRGAYSTKKGENQEKSVQGNYMVPGWPGTEPTTKAATSRVPLRPARPSLNVIRRKKGSLVVNISKESLALIREQGRRRVCWPVPLMNRGHGASCLAWRQVLGLKGTCAPNGHRASPPFQRRSRASKPC